MRSARWAIPLPLLECELRVDVPTAAAALAGWSETVNFHDLRATVGCCPLKDFDKLTKRYIIDFASPEFLHPRKI